MLGFVSLSVLFLPPPVEKCTSGQVRKAWKTRDLRRCELASVAGCPYACTILGSRALALGCVDITDKDTFRSTVPRGRPLTRGFLESNLGVIRGLTRKSDPREETRAPPATQITTPEWRGSQEWPAVGAAVQEDARAGSSLEMHLLKIGND